MKKANISKIIADLPAETREKFWRALTEIKARGVPDEIAVYDALEEIGISERDIGVDSENGNYSTLS